MQEIQNNTSYFSPVVRTGQTLIRYFTEEDDAVDYINMITAKDATVTQDHADF